MWLTSAELTGCYRRDVLISGARAGMRAARSAVPAAVAAVSLTLISGCGQLGGDAPGSDTQSVITSTTRIA
ncbi:hypothetical protein ABQF26_24015, partial [Mycolicibacterium elephantis]